MMRLLIVRSQENRPEIFLRLQTCPELRMPGSPGGPSAPNWSNFVPFISRNEKWLFVLTGGRP